jgi:hypothetical protein
LVFSASFMKPTYFEPRCNNGDVRTSPFLNFNIICIEKII